MTGRVDQAERVIGAAADVVWRALTDPKAIVQWLPPEGMTGSFDFFFLHPFGDYRLVMVYDDASAAPGKSGPDRDVINGRFGAIVPGERLVQLATFESGDPAFAGTMRLTWLLSPDDYGTRVTIRAEDVPPGISAEDHEAGLASSLENLAAFVRRGR